MKKVYTLFFLATTLFFGCSADSESSNVSIGNGVGGSTARFASVNDYLYAVDQRNLNIFSVNNGDLASIKNISIGFDIETIFALDDKLFMGSQTGVHIYSIENPTNPVKLALIEHVFSCDPVVADENYAYVTLRSNSSRCGRGLNQLDILNVSDPNSIFTEFSYPMEAPRGLGIDGKFLFVCDKGVKVFDRTDPSNLVQLQHITGYEAYDVIPFQNKLYVTSPSGVYQYSYDQSLDQITFLSHLPVAMPSNE